MTYTIGIDVGGTNLTAGVVDGNNSIIARAKKKTDRQCSAEKLCEDFIELALEATKNAGLSERDISGVGLGIPGSTDRESGVIRFTPNLPFRNTPVRDIFRKRTTIPVYLGNDANCAFLGEFYAGAAKGRDSAVVVTLGTGVGVGAAVGGKVLGIESNGMEGGHMVIVFDGLPCPCGRRGCWEQYASATALIRMTGEKMALEPDSALWELSRRSARGVDGRTAFMAARLGDAAGKQVVERYLRYVAAGLINLVNLFQPEALCLGGGVSNESDEMFLTPLRGMVAAESYKTGSAPTEIIKCALGNDAGIVGAALLGRL